MDLCNRTAESRFGGSQPCNRRSLDMVQGLETIYHLNKIRLFFLNIAFGRLRSTTDSRSIEHFIQSILSRNITWKDFGKCRVNVPSTRTACRGPCACPPARLRVCGFSGRHANARREPVQDTDKRHSRIQYSLDDTPRTRVVNSHPDGTLYKRRGDERL